MKKILQFFLLACGLCFVISGCGIDELKQEIADKDKVLKQCESEKARLNKTVQELKAALAAKDGEIKKERASAVKLNGNLAVTGTDLAAARVHASMLSSELEAAKAELAAAQEQLEGCPSKKPKKEIKKSE
jgi:hypothetical protein